VLYAVVDGRRQLGCFGCQQILIPVKRERRRTTRLYCTNATRVETIFPGHHFWHPLSIVSIGFGSTSSARSWRCISACYLLFFLACCVSVFDFVPAVNSTPIQDLHIDPAYGFAGLGISILIQSASTLYPMSLISKIVYQAADHSPPQVLVSKHSLPLVHPSKEATTIPLGNLLMDKTSSDTGKILNEYGGDLRKFQGHLGLVLKNAYIPLLLDIQEDAEVQNSQLLLQVLLDPQRLQPRARKSSEESITHANGRSKKSSDKRRHRGKR
jgi:hypothetical protein